MNRRAAIVAGTAAITVPNLGIRSASAAALANLPWSGTGIGVEYIANNANITLRNTKTTGFRFKARHTGKLLSVAVHTKGQTYIEANNTNGSPPVSNDDNENYGYGDGGNIRARVFADNGSGMPNFSSEIGRSENRLKIRENYGSGNRVFVFELSTPTGGQVAITIGTRYHIIFENDHPSPITNFVSINWGKTVNSPRVASTPGPWSPYWDQEITLSGSRGTTVASSTASEAKLYQPAFQLRIDPSNGDPDVYWGPINLLSGNGLEPQTSPSDTAHTASGAIYKISNQYLLRQKFKSNRSTAFTVSKVRVPLFHWGASGDVSNLQVNLRRADGTARGVSLTTANLSSSNSLYIGNSYANPWTQQVLVGSAIQPLVIREASFASAVSINTTDTYYLEFARTTGSSTFGLQVAIDEYDSGNSPELLQTAWEGWSLPSTKSVCQAEWSGNSGSSWGICSIYNTVPKPFTEVRARLVV